jgi:hypothetical protein
MDFFSKVFPDEELREYALGRLASFLSGDVSHEHLYIFTGSGSKVQDHRAVRGRIRRVLLQLPTVLTQRRAAAGSALGSSPAPSHVARRAPGARESERLNVGVMKELSGDTTSSVAPLQRPHRVQTTVQHGDDVTRCPPCPDNDGGTWRRIRVIEFGSSSSLSPPKRVRDGPDRTKFKRCPFIMMLTKRCVADRGRSSWSP